MSHVLTNMQSYMNDSDYVSNISIINKCIYLYIYMYDTAYGKHNL